MVPISKVKVRGRASERRNGRRMEVEGNGPRLPFKNMLKTHLFSRSYFTD